MSFAGDLRTNYNPNSNENDKINQYANSIVIAICKACTEVSKTNRKLSGYYYTSGGDHPEINPSLYTRFVYDRTWSKGEREAIQFLNPGIVYHTYSKNFPVQVVHLVRQQLIAKGFLNPVVKFENIMVRVMRGHSAVLLRTKYVDYPGFKFYVDVSW